MDTATRITEHDDTQLCTIEELRARLRIGRSTLHGLVRGGELTPIYIGRAVRFREVDVLRYIESLVVRGRPRTGETA